MLEWGDFALCKSIERAARFFFAAGAFFFTAAFFFGGTVLATGRRVRFAERLGLDMRCTVLRVTSAPEPLSHEGQ